MLEHVFVDVDNLPNDRVENNEIPDIKSKLDGIKAEEQRIQDEITEVCEVKCN